MTNAITGIEKPVTDSVSQKEYVELCKSDARAIIKGKSIIFGNRVFPSAVGHRMNVWPKNVDRESLNKLM